mmetsp:Transcript_10934/g.15743  ORF Transcript_10934/g.15743 Transcript_10934/m.15743 type:complete len:137 (-) Transcript_10934:157-567(-)
MMLNDISCQDFGFKKSLNISQSLLYNPPKDDELDELMNLARNSTHFHGSADFENFEFTTPDFRRLHPPAPARGQAHLDPDEHMPLWATGCPPSPLPKSSQPLKMSSSSKFHLETGDGLPSDVRSSTNSIAMSAKAA